MAEVSYAQGLTPSQVSGETIRTTLPQMGVHWKRAKHWITSPDPASVQKKRRDRLIRLAQTPATWALGWGDAVWWSRLAQPDQHSWGDRAHQLRLQELERPTADPDAQALACSGLRVRHHPTTPEPRLLRGGAGRPVSAVTIDFLAWCSTQLVAQGVTALLVIWDHASWHKSQAVRAWLRQHNRRVQHTGQGVRIVACRLPSKSPWLNPIAPQWVHGKRAVSEPDRLLSAAELEARVCAYYRCECEGHLIMPKKVA